MRLQKLGPNARKTINWASGTSTEIFIYPADSNFTERNFLFRISTATVEAEESTFTFFEGITRHLMILKGELDLIHEGRYSKHLKPFDQDQFSGEWKTRSKGKVTDFNLMLKGGSSGSLKHHRAAAGTTLSFVANSSYNFIFFVSGEAVSDETSANAGDLILLKKDSEASFETKSQCDVIEIEVTLAD
jgi:environmental stress-induced protein Ves